MENYKIDCQLASDIINRLIYSKNVWIIREHLRTLMDQFFISEIAYEREYREEIYSSFLALDYVLDDIQKLDLDLVHN